MPDKVRSDPELWQVLMASQAPSDAVDLGDGIYRSLGISNSYLVTAPGGDLVINTGLPHEGETHRSRFAAVSDAPVSTVVFTQSHVDHIGGWSAFDQPGVELIVQQDYDDVRGYWNRLGPFYGRRATLLMPGLSAAPTDTEPAEPDDPQPTVRFDQTQALDLGGRQVELHATPGGETTDSLVVWLPAERVVFTGNLLGPLFGHVPNLYTVRGDRLRSALAYIRSVDRVRALEAEVLITGHGDPIRGRDEVERALTQLRDAVAFVRDATLDGMNAGKDVFTLMREITLPEHLALGEGHGKVAWDVRAIWEEYAGWFHYDTTTSLYATPARAVWPELAALAGGPAPLVEAAQQHISVGRPLEALHLLDVALAASPDDPAARTAKAEALELLIDASGRVNLSETRWLDAELARTNDRSNP